MYKNMKLASGSHFKMLKSANDIIANRLKMGFSNLEVFLSLFREEDVLTTIPISCCLIT